MRYRIPGRLAFVIDDHESGPEVFLMPLPDGVPVHLKSTSALIWLLAANGEDVVEALSGLVASPPSDLPATTRAFLDELRERGLLRWDQDADD